MKTWRESMVRAQKQMGGYWKLFWRGTRNEIYPGELFNSASEAKMYFRVQELKGNIAQ